MIVIGMEIDKCKQGIEMKRQNLFDRARRDIDAKI